MTHCEDLQRIMAKNTKSSAFKARSLGRRLALQALYQEEMNPSSARNWDLELDLYMEEQNEELGGEERATALEFAKRLFDGVLFRKREIDDILNRAFDKRRTIDRTTIVDRNILRLAAYEITFVKTPKAVAISEAMELGKKFGDKNTRAFLNGVLDQVGKSRENADDATDSDDVSKE